MIETNLVRMPTDFIGDETAYPKLTYVYALHVDGKPWYVGSSKNPTSRYLTHLAGGCVDTKAKIAELEAQGIVPDMRVIDVTDKLGRLHLEAHYIAWLTSLGFQLTNTSRYPRKLKAYRDCPSCYRSLKQNTLTAKDAS